MRVIVGAQTSCQKLSVPKGEQRVYQSLHERLLRKHAATSITLQHLLPAEANEPTRLSQTNDLCQGKFELGGISIGY